MQAKVAQASAGPMSRVSPVTRDSKKPAVRAQSAVMVDAPTTVQASVAPLFTPFQMRHFELKHRMVYPPLTRLRADVATNVPQPIMAEYYGQRATDGGLIISEGTYVNNVACGYPGAPGVWTEEQVEAWKPITKAVHDKGGLIFCQLWHCGRASHPDLIGGRTPVSASAIAIQDNAYTPNGPAPYPVPQPLDKEGIKQTVKDFAAAARNAIAAGFDGVEIHGANGYLIDQFTKSSTNTRTDEYGGSIENRCRFALEVVDAVVAEVGAERTGLRLAPFTQFLQAVDEYPYSTFTYLVEQLNKYKLAYIHMVEARAQGNTDDENAPGDLTPFRKVWHGPFIAAGGFKAESGAAAVESGHADLIAYGRWWIANPDLPKRFAVGAPLTPYDRNTFYAGGEKGYTDYPFLE